jgi:hypothetical protein
MTNRNWGWVLVFVLAARCSGQDSGTYTFLRNDVGARSAALNGSFVSMTADPNTLFYNPASLVTVNSPKVSLSYFKHFMDVSEGSISFAQNAEGIGNIGVGIRYVDYGSFTETDQNLYTLGTFGASEFAVLGGYAMSIDEQTSIGASLEFIHSSIADFRSSAVAVGVGVLYQVPSENLAIGASILNLGKQLKAFASTSESLPLDIKIGITKRPEHLPVLLNLNFHKLNESRDQFFDRFRSFTLGAEFLMSESVSLRLGYNNEQRSDLKLGTSSGLAGFSLGGGILFRQYQVDYAFNSYGKIGGLHRLSLGMNL